MFLAEAAIQLVPDGTLLLHLLMVGVMVFVLNRTLLKPINNILAERYNATLREARSEGYKLLEKERSAALREKDEKIRLYRDEMSRTVAAQVDQTRQQEQKVRGELESQAAAIGEVISSQILRGPAR
jgi:F0F1-type ATP synthase membrane subunit b/b'